jgi:hypothetical protein
VVLALIIFMLPALQALPNGTSSVRQALPNEFYWLPFSVALVLMAAPIIEVGRRLAATTTYPRP